MKKIFIIFLMIFMIIGCSESLNNPKDKVSNFLDKYINLDDEVLKELEYQIESKNYNEKEKNIYRKNLRRQYQNLKYLIKEEEIYDDTSTIYVEIEVYDYVKAIENASNYYLNNQEYFINENNQVDSSKYIDYKLEQISNMNDRIIYDIEFKLYKKNKIWYLDKVDETIISKINGLYSY